MYGTIKLCFEYEKFPLTLSHKFNWRQRNNKNKDERQEVFFYFICE